MRIPATFVLVLALTAACNPFAKKDGDAGADLGSAIDAAAVVEAPGAPHGKNAAMVARFATEVPQNEPKMLGQTATPKTSPSAGTVVATLKAGTVVTRVATNANHSLIVFPDPNVPTDNLMGWVSDAAFSAVVVPKPVVVVVDAGTPAVVDAGTPAVVDAGAPAVVDAGAPKTASCKAGSIAVKLGGADAYACRKVCGANADCKLGAKKCDVWPVYQPAAGAPANAKACHDDQ